RCRQVRLPLFSTAFAPSPPPLDPARVGHSAPVEQNEPQVEGAVDDDPDQSLLGSCQRFPRRGVVFRACGGSSGGGSCRAAHRRLPRELQRRQREAYVRRQRQIRRRDAFFFPRPDGAATPPGARRHRRRRRPAFSASRRWKP
ncbi:unnamed protein product, partial [Ectocarpus sp. 12 AP-2014]